MSIGTILAWLLRLWGFLRGGKGTRIKIDARPEASIEAERKRLEKLKAKIKEIDNELTDVTIRLVKAKALECNSLVARLDDKRQYLMRKLRDAKREYDDAKRLYS
jgi:hypothetical protein